MSIKVVLSEKPSFTTDKGLIRAQEILFAAHRILATRGSYHVGVKSAILDRK